MAELDKEIRIQETQDSLRELRQLSINRWKKLAQWQKNEVIEIVQEFMKTRDPSIIRLGCENVKIKLHLNSTPVDFAWTSKYNGYFGFLFTIKNAWGWLLKAAEVSI